MELYARIAWYRNGTATLAEKACPVLQLAHSLPLAGSLGIP